MKASDRRKRQTSSRCVDTRLERERGGRREEGRKIDDIVSTCLEHELRYFVFTCALAMRQECSHCLLGMLLVVGTVGSVEINFYRSKVLNFVINA